MSRQRNLQMCECWRKIFYLTLLACIVLASRECAYAAGGRGRDAKLDDLNRKIEQQSADLRLIYKDQKKLRKEQESIQAQLQKIKKEDLKLKEKLNSTIAEWKAVSERIGEIEGEIDLLRARTRERIKVLYLARSEQLERNLLISGGLDDIYYSSS